MIAEYITLEQAAEAFAIQTVFSTNDCLDMLYYAIQKGWISPSDVTPVRHGRWIEQEKYTFGVMYDCSICGDRILDNGHSWNYCPNCGCLMDGGAE